MAREPAPLYAAVKQEDICEVQRLLKKAGTQVDEVHVNGITPLMAASFRGSVLMVQTLLRAKAAVDAKATVSAAPPERAWLIPALVHRTSMG